jgi:hypothetical protein
MTREDALGNAFEWFKVHNISVFIENDTMYISDGTFEFQLSSAEVYYRAEEYIRLKTNNLIKTK